MATSKFEKAVTPKGVAIFPHLNTPDTKFDKAGQYRVRLAFTTDTPGLEEFREKLQKHIDERFEAEALALKEQGKAGLVKKLKKTEPLKVEEDPETGEPTGRLILSAKMKASGTSQKTGKPWTRKPDFFDAKGKALKNPPMIGGGSELKLQVELGSYYIAKDQEAGVTAYLNAVQIIRLVQYGSRDAASYGFGEEEGDELDDTPDSGDSAFDDESAGSGNDDDDI